MLLSELQLKSRLRSRVKSNLVFTRKGETSDAHAHVTQKMRGRLSRQRIRKEDDEVLFIFWGGIWLGFCSPNLHFW